MVDDVRADDVERALDALADQMGRDTALALCTIYCERTPLLVIAMRRAEATGDVTALRRAAHDLVTNAGTMGFDTLAAGARVVEESAAIGSLSGARAALGRCLDDADAILPHVQRWTDR